MKLMEVVMQTNDQMTTAQQTALLSVFIALPNSPQAGAEALKGDEKRMAAGEYLIQHGFVTVYADGIAITPRGVQELIDMGLIEQGVVTDKGKKLVNPQPQAQQAAPQPAQQAPAAPTGGIT